MRNCRWSASPRTMAWGPAVVALAATFAVAPSVARASCSGDCNGDGQVTVNELIQMVNIALDTLAVSVCTAGDTNGDGEVTVNEIVAGVNVALSGFCEEGGCGDGVKSAAEECDDGGICIGGTNAGVTCTRESDCHGEGVCDSFGSQGPAGSIPRKACSTDDECGGARCVHCKTFGGDGCAANCTLETERILQLAPGEVQGFDIKQGTSGAVVHGDILTLPLPLTGSQTLIRGNERSGLIPMTMKVTGINLPVIPVAQLACACVRGAEYKTCGGTQFEADGQTQSVQCTDVCDANGCTSRASVCDGKKPCTSIAGPGNAAEGVIGCSSLPLVSYTLVQDAGGAKCDPVASVCVDETYHPLGGTTKRCELPEDCPGGTCGCVDAKVPVFTPGSVGGGPGSMILATASAIGSTTGLCEGSFFSYGPDGQFCTDDDPQTSRGVASITTLVTGTATAEMQNENGIDNNSPGPFSATGNPLGCDQITADIFTGAVWAGSFPALDQPNTGDQVDTTMFALQ